MGYTYCYHRANGTGLVGQAKNGPLSSVNSEMITACTYVICMNVIVMITTISMVILSAKA